MKYGSFHTNFRLNGVQFTSKEDVLKYSERISVSLNNFLKNWFSKDEVISVNTSGSTGTPKIIALKKEYMVNSAMATAEFFNLGSNTKALLCLSTEYIAGKMMLVRAMVCGWDLDVVSVSSIVKVNGNYDFCAMVPMQVQNSLDYLCKIKKVIVGGGAISNKLLKRLQFYTTEMYATYGMTETITHVAIKKLNNFNSEQGVSTSFYKALSGVELFVDKRDCLVIKAPSVSDDLIVTNDVVQLISESQFQWKSRYDNVINSGGVKIFPELIEAKLADFIEQRFFLSSISDDYLGNKLVLIVEGSSKLEFKFFDKILDKYEIPKDVYYCEKFVETPTNKIQRSKTLQKVLSKV